MLTLARPGVFPLFMLASILVSLATVPIALTKAQAPAPLRSVEIRLLHLYRLSPAGVVGCLAVGVANGPFWSLAPVYAQERGADTWGAAVFMKIGRASCRERGCPYVWISVVADYFKKKLLV